MDKGVVVAVAVSMIGFIVGYINGVSSGWRVAHETVATECQRLGSFYVGDKTFRCTEVYGRDEGGKQ